MNIFDNEDYFTEHPFLRNYNKIKTYKIKYKVATTIYYQKINAINENVAKFQFYSLMNYQNIPADNYIILQINEVNK